MLDGSQPSIEFGEALSVRLAASPGTQLSKSYCNNLQKSDLSLRPGTQLSKSYCNNLQQSDLSLRGAPTCSH